MYGLGIDRLSQPVAQQAVHVPQVLKQLASLTTESSAILATRRRACKPRGIPARSVAQ